MSKRCRGKTVAGKRCKRPETADGFCTVHAPVTPESRPKRPPRKKERFTVDQIAEALRASRGFISAAARRLACGTTTIYEYIDRHPELSQVRRDAREEQKDIAEIALAKAVQEGQAWAVCFYLKTQAKDRGYVQRSEHSGPDGVALPAAIPIYLVKPEDDE